MRLSVEPLQVEQRHARLVLRVHRRRVDGREEEALPGGERRRLMVLAAAADVAAGIGDARQLDDAVGARRAGLRFQLVDHERQAVELGALVDAGGRGVDG
jgi:hypothetical protein